MDHQDQMLTRLYQHTFLGEHPSSLSVDTDNDDDKADDGDLGDDKDTDDGDDVT